MIPDIIPPLQIKADRDGFILAPDPGASFQTIKAYLEQRLEESHDFFKNSKMVLDLRTRPFRANEISELRDLLAQNANVTLMEVRLGENLNSFFSWASQFLEIPIRGVSNPESNPPPPVIVRNTCRSGTRIESPSDCIVLGDVNPGAEVLAIGDIIIFGTLRGTVHAGAAGDRSARIWALSIEPNQIRIADLVAVPPQGNKPHAKRYEVAEIREDLIQVTTV